MQSPKPRNTFCGFALTSLSIVRGNANRCCDTALDRYAGACCTQMHFDSETVIIYRRCSLSHFQSIVLRERIDVDPERMDDRGWHLAALDGFEPYEADGFQLAKGARQVRLRTPCQFRQLRDRLRLLVPNDS